MASARASGVSRREEYAGATRRAILDAARQLFATHGYFSTKVDEIAALARVAPATVYAVSGGKHGLLRRLMDSATTDPIVASTIGSIADMDDAHAILRLVAASCRTMHEQHGDVMRVMLTTAPHDPVVAATLSVATSRYRKAFVPIAERLEALGALPSGTDVAQAVDVLWFYFGYAGLLTLHDDNGWTYERAAQWLCDQASRALLRRR